MYLRQENLILKIYLENMVALLEYVSTFANPVVFPMDYCAFCTLQSHRIFWTHEKNIFFEVIKDLFTNFGETLD